MVNVVHVHVDWFTLRTNTQESSVEPPISDHPKCQAYVVTNDSLDHNYWVKILPH